MPSGEANNGRAGIIGGLISTVGKLPGEFLAMVLLTLGINLGMIWLFSEQGASRERVLAPLIEACAHSVPLEAIRILQPNPGRD